MDREQLLLAAAALAAVALGVLLSPWSPLVAKAAPQGQEGMTWSPTSPRTPHYARGGLWHPPTCGEGRTGLLRHGWAWIASPPSEVTGPGVTDG